MGEETQAWEELLDLHDSDLPPLRPLKRHHHPHQSAAATGGGGRLSGPAPILRRCSSSATAAGQFDPPLPPQRNSSHRQIPGPAGILQAAMLRRKNQHNDDLVLDGLDPIPTQEYVRRALEDGGADDEDYSRDPWISAVDFVRREGLADGNGEIGIPLCAVKYLNNADRAAQVVAIVKSCTSNGLGDMMVNLKDPTGCIDASIHRKVISEVESGKEISVGAVIIIKKVAVFSPSRSSHCLNVTRSNVVKIFSKDYKAPLEDDPPAKGKKALLEDDAPAITDICNDLLPKPPSHSTPDPRNQTSTSQTQNRFLPSQTQAILNNLKRNTTSTEKRADSKQMKRTEVVTLKEKDTRHGPNEVAITRDDQSGKEDEACIVFDLRNDPENDDKVSDMVLEEEPRSQSNNGNGDTVVESMRKMEGGRCSQGKVLSLPEWTDEQLNELFDMD